MDQKDHTTTNEAFAEETIVAIATPPGQGGVGVVRISGPRALACGLGIFSFDRDPGRIQSHRLYVGSIVLGEKPAPATRGRSSASSRETGCGNDGIAVDRALFVLMRAPHSYTGQDVVELQCHGSPLLLGSVVTAAVSLGARPAGPGEFTRRAFMNGKIDLMQAEAVADLIAARTPGGLSVFSRQLMGGLSAGIFEVRSGLLSILADLEAAIDFPEQDVTPPEAGGVAGRLEEGIARVDRLLRSYRDGRAYREGARLVIAGRPNVGKSSLMNRLLGRPRAIVAPDPGTTTDTIEDVMDLGGFPVTLVDTCGLREGLAAVEREGIERARGALESADVIILVGEATAGIGRDEREVIEGAAAAGRPLVVVMNKADLVAGNLPPLPDIPVPGVFASALVGTGIDELKSVARSLVGGGGGAAREALIVNERHHAALVAAADSLRQAGAGVSEGVPPEFIALDVRRALSALGEMTGEITSQEVLDEIFSRFCIGK